MAGYNSYSKSNNAVEAEQDDCYPLTKAVKIVAAKAGCTQKKAREVLLELGSNEYHHSSKFYNCVDYYDIMEQLNLLKNLLKRKSRKKKALKYLSNKKAVLMIGKFPYITKKMVSYILATVVIVLYVNSFLMMKTI